jgi:hypothetical protein
METRDTVGSSSSAEHGKADDRPRELDYGSLPCLELPRPSFSPTEYREPELTTKDSFQVQGDDLRIKSVEKLPLALRPDPAFRRFHPIASGLLMMDDLGNAKGYAESEAAVLRYDPDGRVVAQAGFNHKFYRLGLHPHGREFIAMSDDCVLHAYDDDLRLLWRTRLADAPQVQALCQRLGVCDEWLKNHIRCVALSRDRSCYLFTAVDELWCADLSGNVRWGLRLPRRNDHGFGFNTAVSADVSEALKVLELRLPTTPQEIQARYRELALRWHPDRNGSAQAHPQMAALNSAIERLRDVDPGILSGDRASGGAAGGAGFDDGVRPSINFGFARGFDADWIYAADFAAHSNAVYLGSYSGRVVALDPDGEARQVHHVGVPPRRIIDTGEFLYILTHAAIYVLRHGSLKTIIELHAGGEVMMVPNGFGVLEIRQLRCFRPDGKLLGTVVSADPIRRIYQPGEGLAVETRTRRVTIAGVPSWWG